MVFVTVGAAGSMFEGQRATGNPSRSSRYFVKFHSGGAPISSGSPARAVKTGLAEGPITDERENSGNVTPNVVEQNDLISPSSAYSCWKSLEGKPRITKPCSA